MDSLSWYLKLNSLTRTRCNYDGPYTIPIDPACFLSQLEACSDCVGFETRRQGAIQAVQKSQNPQPEMLNLISPAL